MVVMEHMVYKIGEVSTRLGLVDKNSNTLRGWTEEFGEFLSATANPAPGQPRRYTARDLHVLTAVREYRANHLSYDEIRERLRAGEHDVTPQGGEEPPVYTSEGAQPGPQALAPLAQLERLLAPLAASVDEWRRLAEEYRGRLEAREARIEALERRIEDLYGRLDTLPGAVPTSAAPESAPAGETTVAAAATAPADEHPGPSTNGAAAAPAPEAMAPLFPRPTVERAPQEAPAAPPAPRRRWWRVWR